MTRHPPAMKFQTYQPLIPIIVLASLFHLSHSSVSPDLKIGAVTKVNDDTIFYCQDNVGVNDRISLEVIDRTTGWKSVIPILSAFSMMYNSVAKDAYYHLYHGLYRLYFPVSLSEFSGNFDVKCLGSTTGSEASVTYTNNVPSRAIMDGRVDYSVLDMDTATPINRCEVEETDSTSNITIGILEMGQTYTTFFCQTRAFWDSEAFKLFVTADTVIIFHPVSLNSGRLIYRDFMKNEFNQRYREYFRINMTSYSGSVSLTCISQNTNRRASLTTYTPPAVTRTITPTFSTPSPLNLARSPGTIGLGCEVSEAELPAFNCSGINMEIQEKNIKFNKLETRTCGNPTKSGGKVKFLCGSAYRPPHEGNFKAICSGFGKLDPSTTVSTAEKTFDAFGTPNLSFGKDCSRTYKEGKSRITCTCTLQSRRPDFYSLVLKTSPNGGLVTGRENVEITHDYNPSNQVITIECTAKLKVDDRKLITVTKDMKYAYGPTQIKIKPISGVLTKAAGITVVCQLTADDYSPSDSVNVMAEILTKSSTTRLASLKCTRLINHDFPCVSWTPTQLGELKVRCIGTNSEYSSFSVSTETAIIVNGPPVIRLVDCQRDDVKTITVRGEKSTTCTCEMTDPGYPVSQPKWYDQAGNVAASGNPKAALTVQPRQEKQNFSCVAKSSFQNSNILEYEAVFIYGPGAMSVFPISGFPTIANPPNISCFMSDDNISSKDKSEVVAEIFSVSTGAKVGSPLNCTFISGTNLTYDCPVWTPASVGQFKVKCKGYNSLYPELFNISSDYPFAIYGNSTVKLSNCPLDSNNMSVPIVGKKTGSCSCEVAEPGYPPAQARWYNPSGSVVVSGTPSAVLSVVTAIHNDTFTCKGVSSYGESQQLQYKAMLIYGPDKVTVGVESNDIQSGYLMVYCEVKRSDVLPGWNTSLEVTGISTHYAFNRTVVDLKADTSRAYYKVNVTNVKVKFTVECKVNNTKETSLGAVASKEIDDVSDANAGASSDAVSSDSLKIAFGAVGAFMFLWIIILAVCLLKKLTGKKNNNQDEGSSGNNTPPYSQKQMVTPNGPGQDLVMRQMELNLPRVSEVTPFPGYSHSQPGLSSGWKG